MRMTSIIRRAAAAFLNLELRLRQEIIGSQALFRSSAPVQQRFNLTLEHRLRLRIVHHGLEHDSPLLIEEQRLRRALHAVVLSAQGQSLSSDTKVIPIAASSGRTEARWVGSRLIARTFRPRLWYFSNTCCR